jgi:phosphoenolpyruvate---glycerone phosphotransferase subunit DhaL
MMAAAASRIREQHAWLSQLDCTAGDGDHGSTMLRTMIRLEQVFTSDAAGDFKVIFSEAGWSVMGGDGGASSSLLGAFFLGIGEAIAPGISSWSCAELAAAFQVGVAAVQVQTKAQPGDKTMMDALVPAVEALTAASRKGLNIANALADAARAAQSGADATKDMIARFGRARLLGEKTRGSSDPGAASIALIFDGFSSALAESEGDIGIA